MQICKDLIFYSENEPIHSCPHGPLHCFEHATGETLINRAKVDGQLGGVVHHLVDGGLSILQYVDDILLFMITTSKKSP